MEGIIDHDGDEDVDDDDADAGGGGDDAGALGDHRFVWTRHLHS